MSPFPKSLSACSSLLFCLAMMSCGGGSKPAPDGDFSLATKAAGVAPVYPWIYTGGLDPGLWVPIPGVQTLNLLPYRVDLTPFAGTLNDGQPHTVGVSVFNAYSFFSVTAQLLVFEDHGSRAVTGEVTENTLSGPNPTVVNGG